MSYAQALTVNQNAVLTAIVSDAPFKCLFCKKVFISETYLSRHKTRKHGMPSPSFLQLQEQSFSESELCDRSSYGNLNKSTVSYKLEQLINRLDDKSLTGSPVPELYRTCYTIVSPKPVPTPRSKPKIDSSINTDTVLTQKSVSIHARPITRDFGVNTEVSYRERSTNTKTRVLSKSETFKNSFVPKEEIEPEIQGGVEWQDVAYEFSKSTEESDSKISSRIEVSPDVFLEELFEKLKNNYYKEENRARLQVEEIFESKLRELGLDPERRGLELSSMQHAEVFLKSKKDFIAKKYPHFYSLRDKICEEVENLVKERFNLENF